MRRLYRFLIRALRIPQIHIDGFIVGKGIVCALLILLCALLQTTLFARFRPFGAIPDLMLSAVIAISLLEGEKWGAVTGLFAPGHEIKVIGIRHGEKMYETLLTNEECANAVDLGNFYRVPSDKRDLNYDKYFKEGDTERNVLTEFNSNNTKILNVEEVKEKLLELDYIRERLEEFNA